MQVWESEGKPILHPYLVFPAHANDLFNAVQAAQTAFRDLSKHFVLMGHSKVEELLGLLLKDRRFGQKMDTSEQSPYHLLPGFSIR